MTGALTTNDLTARLLIEIPKHFAGSRVWRRNVGKAVGMDTVAQAVRLIAAGRVKEGVTLLQSRPLKFGTPGEPDIEGILPIGFCGCWLGVEVKTGRDKMTEGQVLFRDMIVRAGGIFVEARDVETALGEIATAVEEKRLAQDVLPLEPTA